MRFTITSPCLISETLAEKSMYVSNCWIGLIQREGVWTWIDNSPLSFFNWAPGTFSFLNPASF